MYTEQTIIDTVFHGETLTERERDIVARTVGWIRDNASVPAVPGPTKEDVIIHALDETVREEYGLSLDQVFSEKREQRLSIIRTMCYERIMARLPWYAPHRISTMLHGWRSPGAIYNSMSKFKSDIGRDERTYRQYISFRNKFEDNMQKFTT